MADAPPHALEVTPESALQFTLTRTPETPTGGSTPNEPTSRCTMTLRHTGGTSEHLAFKVKTTQPRRYLVRPNQGVVAPNSTETVSILLVERDKQILLHSFDRLGQSALDHSKDKFLVQSCAVSNDFAKKYMEEKSKAKKSDEGAGSKASGMSKEMADSLTSMWNAVSSGGSVPVFNKKLHVRHVVPKDSAAPTTDRGLPAADPSAPAAISRAPPALQETSKTNVENMTPDQMFAEIASLRRKYDELVSFSVNLTAERDILNNTLEQTKRDLNREMAARSALENSGGARGGGTKSEKSKGGGLSILQILVVALVFFFMGVKLSSSGAVGFLGDIPVLGSALGMDERGSELATEAGREMGGSDSEL
eukprot:CAMPEP_0197436834 /NCGR_PEP_ID=MMETSP1175-20131217/4208_1 /TAXON_ID=1003142 /ORGANISM="Triceratium dubium, Strain CCMP147" /LENGTH=364 /DNA_ID=CAMNT_0042966217 /DNA_START=68 /DNA_END=1162 /DNA_ORIENTATION=-